MGAVYFLKQKNVKGVKIGYSKEENPIKRVNSYKTYFPYGLDFIGYISFNNFELAREFEIKTHKYFKLSKIQKEWFDIDINQIQDYLSKNNLQLLKQPKDLKKSRNQEIDFAFYKEGKTVNEISKLYNLSIQSVYKILKIKSKVKKTNKKIEDIFNFYSINNNVKETALEFNVSIQYVYKVLKANKLCN